MTERFAMWLYRGIFWACAILSFIEGLLDIYTYFCFKQIQFLWSGIEFMCIAIMFVFVSFMNRKRLRQFILLYALFGAIILLCLGLALASASS